jgi:thiol-disulfide isomerase/thioredoxin
MVLNNRARVAFVLAAMIAFTAPQEGAQAQDSGIELGAKAPGAAIETLAGAPAELASVFGKGPVVIEFWATWCPNCKELEPTMLAAERKYAGKVTFVGVAVSVNQSPRAVQAYVDKHALQMTHFFDRHGKAVGAYDVPATSFVVVVNRAGRVVYTGLGGRQDLEAAIKRAF